MAFPAKETNFKSITVTLVFEIPFIKGKGCLLLASAVLTRCTANRQATHLSMADLNIDAAAPHLDESDAPVSDAPVDVIGLLMQNMSDQERFTCALVCKAWASHQADCP